MPQAARDGKEDVVRHYLDRLADSEKQEVINARDSEGYTALHYAAKFNRFQIMYRLVTHDAGEGRDSFLFFLLYLPFPLFFYFHCGHVISITDNSHVVYVILYI